MFVLFFLLMLTRQSLAEDSPHFLLSKSQWEDRVKGALIGSVLGDALGRITEPLGNSAQIKLKYGKQGIRSFKEMSKCEWLYEPFKHKSAAYGSNTVMALLTFDACLKGRQKKLSDEQIAENLGQQIINQFGSSKFELDTHFSFRRHSAATIKSAERLAAYTSLWSKMWLQEEKTENKKGCLLSRENESSALARSWPVGLVFADNDEKVQALCLKQALLTDEHPAVVAASVAFSLGIAYALRGESPTFVADQMIRAAQPYEHIEKPYKPLLHVMESEVVFSHQIALSALSTSDLIRYAKKAQSYEPQEIFDEDCIEENNMKSEQGYLNTYHADEAVAAAVYIFLRHPDDPRGAIIEAANVGGRTSLIASLVGALVGARCGFAQIENAFGWEMELLENVDHFYQTADNFSKLKDIDGTEISYSNLIACGCLLSVLGSVVYLLQAEI